MEKQLSNWIIDYITEQPGGFAHKRLSNGSTSTNGWPDVTGSLIFPAAGHLFAIRLEVEVKQPGKIPDQLQYSLLRRFRRLGIIAFWTDSREDFLNKLQIWSNVASGKAKHPGYRDITGKKVCILGDLLV